MRDIVSPLDGFLSPFGQRRVFSPLSLFASGEEGAWYEPSTTTCFTDTGGTTPATYGDAVAYLQDLSGNGNHATQATAASRPILARVPEGGRRNLLEYTEDLTQTYWTKTAVTADANTITETATTNIHRFFNTPVTVGAGATVSAQVKLKKNAGHDYAYVGIGDNGGRRAYVIVNLTNGQITESGVEQAGTGATLIGQSVSPLGAGEYLVSVTGSIETNETAAALIVGISNSATPGGLPSYLGNVANSIDATAMQLETGSTATAYQKVVDEYDITEAGVTSLEYLSFDGSDDALLVSSASLNTALNSSDSAMMGGFSGNGGVIFLNNTVDNIHAGITPIEGTGLRAIYRNTTFVSSEVTYETPSVIYGFFDASAKTATVRGNGVDGTASAASNNTITVGNLLSIGALARVTPIYYEGGFYGGIVLDRAFTTQQISQTETYLAAKSGVTL